MTFSCLLYITSSINSISLFPVLISKILELENDRYSIVNTAAKLATPINVTINDIISTHLKGYTIERLYKIDLAIIMLAVVELKFIKETPKEVVINQAVELAKKYSTEKSPRFINGVLADIVK